MLAKDIVTLTCHGVLMKVFQMHTF